MKKLVVVVLTIVGCGDTEITPETTSSGSGGSANGTGGNTTSGGGDGGGGSTNEGGNGAAGGGMPGGGFESGSRLKARTLVGDDGSRSPSGWFDSELSIECSFRKAADGETRCLPNGNQVVYFSDGACQVPIVVSACPPGAHVLLIEDACSGAARVFPVSGSSSPALVYIKVGPNCTNVITPSLPIYSVGAEVSASAFVGTTLETEP